MARPGYLPFERSGEKSLDFRWFGLGDLLRLCRAGRRLGHCLLRRFVDQSFGLAPSYGVQLLQDHPERTGYLLKERVSDIAVLVDALRRIADGECVLDPTIVARLVANSRRRDPLADLTHREREVLTLMAEGRSNAAIAERLVVTPRTVEAHVRQILGKLDLRESPDDHRRVLAVLTYLRS